MQVTEDHMVYSGFHSFTYIFVFPLSMFPTPKFIAQVDSCVALPSLVLL